MSYFATNQGKMIKLALILLYMTFSCEAENTPIFVIPGSSESNATTCDFPCYTLVELHQQILKKSVIIGSQTICWFYGGDHIIDLETPEHFVVKDVTNLTLWGNGARIVCKKPFGFAFLNIPNLTMLDLSFIDCGQKLNDQLLQNTLAIQTNAFKKMITKQPKVTIFGVNMYSLLMSATEIKNSSGYGLVGINLIGDSMIILSRFLNNNLNSFDHCLDQNLTQSEEVDCTGGNALLLYGETNTCPENPVTFNLTVKQSLFSKGADLVTGKRSVIPASGLGVALTQRTYGMKIILEGSVFEANAAVTNGANLHFAILNSVVNSSVNIRDCKSTYGNTLFAPNNLHRAGTFSGLSFTHGTYDIRNVPHCSIRRDKTALEEVLHVENSLFLTNFGGAILTSFAARQRQHPSAKIVKNSDSYAYMNIKAFSRISTVAF